MSHRPPSACSAFALVLALVLGTGCAAPDGTQPRSVDSPTELNKEIVRRFVEAMNERRFDDLDELVSPDVVRHSPSTPGLEVRNLDQFKDFLRQDLTSVPDAMQEIRMMVAEGDLVAVWAGYSGTQDGPLGPFPPTGRPVEIDFAGFLRLEEGLITEIHVVWDNLNMLVQLGHMELPASEGD